MRELIVTGAGILLIIWVNWYFLYSGRRESARKRGRKRKTPSGQN